MDHDTAHGVALIENLVFDSQVDDFSEETTDQIDMLGIRVDIPIGTGEVPAELPFYISVRVFIGEDGLIDSVELASDQALPIAASVAADGLSATGVLPRVSYHQDGAVIEERAFGLGGPFATSSGEWSIVGESWTYTLDSPTVTGERDEQFTMWSVGSAYDIPRAHPFRYVNPEDWEAGDETWTDWPEVPATMDADTLTAVKASFDPKLGRVPGSESDKLVLDSRLGLQLCDFLILPDTTPPASAGGPIPCGC